MKKYGNTQDQVDDIQEDLNDVCGTVLKFENELLVLQNEVDNLKRLVDRLVSAHRVLL